MRQAFRMLHSGDCDLSAFLRGKLGSYLAPGSLKNPAGSRMRIGENEHIYVLSFKLTTYLVEKLSAAKVNSGPMRSVVV